MNHKKLYRLYREEGLTVRRRGGRKRATGTRAPMTIPQGPNQRWSLDFVADVLSWGRRFRVLAIVDDFTREALALVVDTSIGGRRVARALDALIARRGRPAMIVSDNGTELTSRAVREWTNRTGIPMNGLVAQGRLAGLAGRLVQKALDARFGKASLPASHRRPADPGAPRDLGEAQPLGRDQRTGDLSHGPIIAHPPALMNLVLASVL